MFKPSVKYQKDSFNSSGVRSQNKGHVYIPLQFWFNNEPGLALPLIALQHSEIRLLVTFNPASKMYKSYDVSTKTLKIAEVKLYCDYIYLDLDERKKFSETEHEYLIEQVQFSNTNVIKTTDTTKDIRLDFSRPIKELIWVVQDDYVDVGRKTKGLLVDNGDSGTNGFTLDSEDLNLLYSYSRGFSLSHDDGPELYDQVDSVSILFNGIAYFNDTPASYFRTIQRYDHHEGKILNPCIYLYSFALKLDQFQPSLMSSSTKVRWKAFCKRSKDL